MNPLLIALLVVLGVPLSASAQSVLTKQRAIPVGNPFPLASETVINLDLSYEDEWANVAMKPDGSGFSVSWNDASFSSIRSRFFTGAGVPLTGDVLVNAGFNSGTQDEPMSASDAFGNVFIGWTDRPGNDGDCLGTFGRILMMDGTPVGPDFVINATTVNSQWEPMPAPLPDGGWVVAFNGDDDGDAYLRYFDIGGTPITNDIQINTFDNNGQTEAEVRVLPDGTVLAVFADFGGNVYPFTGTNLFGRRFDVLGNAIDSFVWPLHPSTTPFDQLEPRMSNSDDTIVAVWEDRGNDGSGSGIWARRFKATGPFEPEFRVNVLTFGNQNLPDVACSAQGEFVVCWEDWATGVSRVRARAYDSEGNPMGLGFWVSEGAAGGYKRPTVAMSADGMSVVFAYGGPPIGGSNDTQDIYVRRYAWAFVSGRDEATTSRPQSKGAPALPGPLPGTGITPILK